MACTNEPAEEEQPRPTNVDATTTSPGSTAIAPTSTAPEAAAPSTTAPTISTQPPTETSEATAPPSGVGQVGYLGCSMSTDAVIGYYQLGGSALWEASGGKNAGGALDLWARVGPNRMWTSFQEELDAHPGTTALWWELCTTEAGREEDLDLGLLVLAEIERRLPGATVFISAQPAYDGHVCPTSGADGPAEMATLAAQLVGTGQVLGGPAQGPLTESMTRDLCHASESGRLLLGEQLLAFFGD